MRETWSNSVQQLFLWILIPFDASGIPCVICARSAESSLKLIPCASGERSVGGLGSRSHVATRLQKDLKEDIVTIHWVVGQATCFKLFLVAKI